MNPDLEFKISKSLEHLEHIENELGDISVTLSAMVDVLRSMEKNESL